MFSLGPMQRVPPTGAVQPLSGASGGARINPTDLGQASPTDGTGNVPAGSPIGNAGANAAGGTTDTLSSPTRGADELKKLVAHMQTRLSGANANLVFSVDQDSGRSIVKVTERNTNEVIWQFPTDQALQESKELGRYLGALVNSTA
jgi:flagellar protein FlaG